MSQNIYTHLVHIETICQWIHRLMESKKILIYCVCTKNILYVTGAYLQCDRNEVNHHIFLAETSMFFVCMGKHKPQWIWHIMNRLSQGHGFSQPMINYISL